MEKAIAGIKFAGAGICTTVCGFLGGMDIALRILYFFVGVDIVTGVLKAIYNKRLNSQPAYQGGIKKIGIFLIVGIAYALDQYMNMTILRSCAIGYYIANEGISIVENWGQMGLRLPKVLKTILQQLQEQSDNGNLKGGK